MHEVDVVTVEGEIITSGRRVHYPLETVTTLPECTKPIMHMKQLLVFEKCALSR